MAMDSPFLLFKVECPICKTINEFETIRVGAYAEEGRDTDFCPVNVKWRFPRYQAYNPLVFFTATCSNCFYSREFTNNFKDWKNDTTYKTYKLKTVKTKHLENLTADGSIIKKLGQSIDLNRFPNESAIVKLLLAVYDEQLSDHHSRLDVGRFYLRIGWVFRDMERNENPNRILLTGLMQELEEAYEHLMRASTGVKSETESFSNAVKSHFDSPQLSADFKAQMLSFSDRYQETVSGLKDTSAQFSERLLQLRALINDYRTALLGSGGSEQSAQAFGHYGSFVDFLQALKQHWSGVVCNEREALEKAVLYYKEAFANGKDIAPGNQQIQASYLIAELSRRIGDYDEARQYFTSTIKSGQEFIYQNRQDQSRTALARKILELAIEQGRSNLAASKPA